VENARYQELIQVESIPPLPETAARLLTMVLDPEVEVGTLARTIERDPPLTARILGIANSAFYAPPQPVMTVKAAIVGVLGLNLVRNLAVGMALTGGLSTRACPRFDLTAYWVLALGTAELASALARASTKDQAPAADTAYLAGLLHNLGELLLAHLWPQEMNEALRRQSQQPAVGLEAHERALLGTDHWAAGAFLARHWELPPVIGDSIELFPSPPKGGGGPPLLALLRAARGWVAGLAGQSPVRLHVPGVDAGRCESHANAFLDRYEALKALARTLR
jgi:HD-like signal output (HDOD) protein